VLGGGVYLSDQMTARLLRNAVAGNENKVVPTISQLTDRELQVFQLIGHGLTTRQIAQQLHLDVKTVETYRFRIKEKLHLSNATALLQHAVQWVQESGVSRPGAQS